MLRFAASLMYSIVQQFAGLFKQNVNVRCSRYEMKKKTEVKEEENRQRTEYTEN
jgi:hypothetical protein